MENAQAAEHLQIIRTLMERSALYRRTLAPVMTCNGALGIAGALAGRFLHIESPRAFVLYWAGVAVVAMTGSLLLVRRQALKDAEPFWSPPTRRVTQAFLPALAAGCCIGVVALLKADTAPAEVGHVMAMLWLPLAWVVLYGCGLHSSGFFTPRGLRCFGWALILGGCGAFACGIPDGMSRLDYAHGIMGFFFGVMHLAYGVYLYFTEKGKNAA